MDGAERHRDISIHALREEGDSFQCSQSSRLGTFLSTPSARRATLAERIFLAPDSISIHALREEGDSFIDNDTVDAMIFLSTPSARRATRSRARS